MKASDRVFLALAVELAEGGRMTCAPNPTVGCVIFHGGKVIGRGFHQRTGEAHAEVNAITDAGGSVAGATVYVSLEPCAFVSRTPACAQTLIDARVARVVIAALDPHPKVAGLGVDMLQQAGIEVCLIELAEAQQCIAGYVSRVSHDKPFVRLKTATSMDGATALASGESQWITGVAARADAQYWRGRADAIITGVGTVLADDPQLNVRAPEFAACTQPLRVVLDAHLRTPAHANVVVDDAATVLVHEPNANIPEYLSSRNAVRLLSLPAGPRDLPAVLTYLAAQGCNEVLVEAGAEVCGSFVDAQLWDEWLCYLAPKWLGAEAQGAAQFRLGELAAAPVGKIVDVAHVGDDLRVRLTPSSAQV